MERQALHTTQAPAMTEIARYVVLVVEDEPDILAVLAYQLAQAGHSVRTALSGGDALRLVEIDPPDLIVLDLRLPEMDGLEVLRTLRAREESRGIPILVLTALSGEEHRVRGLELGADDYVAKPFNPRELLLRIEGLLKRHAVAEGRRHRRVLRAGPIELDISGHRVTVQGREVSLTRMEFRLLQVLVRRQGTTQSREALLEAVWQTAAPIETRTVDMHIRRLRKKLGAHAGLVETVRGFGYRLRADS
jgi:two-component system phosphate regulon response regulator PhoB